VASSDAHTFTCQITRIDSGGNGATVTAYALCRS
jgi:hypothetical protein